MITVEIFSKIFYILGFFQSPEDHVSLPRQENVRMEALFKKPLPEPVTYILYAEFPGKVESENFTKYQKNEYHSDR